MLRALRFGGLLAGALLMVLPGPSAGRPPIRADFFTYYPNAVGSKLDVLPSNSKHCGVCHFDFNGGGPRNPYGTRIELGRAAGLTNLQAIQAAEAYDSDGDGFLSPVEITDTAHFSNTPTFPGLTPGNTGSVLNIPLAEINPYLVPTGSTDTTPPTVTVTSPNGGESIVPNGFRNVTYTATDASGISEVSIYLSDDGGTTFKPMGLHLPPTGTYAWFVPNLPGGSNRIRVVAIDNAGNPGQDGSNANFSIQPFAGGLAPTTFRDVSLPGTQPLTGVVLDDPETSCFACHANYDVNNEPGRTWRGGMMSQAMRDPLFLACLAVAEQDAPSVGDLCLRCHTPGGWMEGRSVDTRGGLVTAKDRKGIQCDFCHRLVDRNYVAGTSPIQDVAVLAAVSPLPLQYANGQYIADPAPLRRGPFSDVSASHDVAVSPFHRSSNLCGTCHDVSNPVYVKTGPRDYTLNAFDAPHPDMDLRNMFPIERTMSEWSQSAYAAGGVYQPQFAGDKPDGMVSTCQDCHMRDVTAKGCNEPGVPNRSDLPLHDLMGGNAFIPDILPLFYPAEVNVTELAAAKARAIHMLQLAATLEVTPLPYGVRVKVTNETGHKLPSGYPEGRRIWINVKAKNASGQPVYESAAYDNATGVLTHDEDATVYEIHPGLSPALAQALGFPAGPSFHFVLNDTVWEDNRIPPRGFTNAGFEAIQSPPVAHAYEDGQHWDITDYFLPAGSDSATVTLYYQTISKEYVEFLRDANVTNTAGQDFYNAWAATGRSTPVKMAQATVKVTLTSVGIGDDPRLVFALAPGRPNPFATRTAIGYSLPQGGRVDLAVYDVAGRRVRVLVNDTRNAGKYEEPWDGRGDRGERLASGIYFVRLRALDREITQRLVLLP